MVGRAACTGPALWQRTANQGPPGRCAAGSLWSGHALGEQATAAGRPVAAWRRVCLCLLWPSASSPVRPPHTHQGGPGTPSPLLQTELYRHIGNRMDVPAGDIGVGPKEVGYLVSGGALQPGLSSPPLRVLSPQRQECGVVFKGLLEDARCGKAAAADELA